MMLSFILACLMGIADAAQLKPDVKKDCAEIGEVAHAFAAMRDTGMTLARAREIIKLLGDFRKKLYSVCVFHGFLPPNPWEGCHSNHVKAATQSTGSLPRGPREGCPLIQAKPATLGAQRRWMRHCEAAVAFLVNLPGDLRLDSPLKFLL
jgi:hypothetical protein